MEINIQIGTFAKAVEKYKNVTLENEKELYIKDLNCRINTPSGLTTINYIIKKENLKGLKIILKNGVEVKCANYHILQKNNNDVYAIDLSQGDKIDTINGPIEIIGITEIDDSTFYDINIDSPHLYYDDLGVLHHNTLTTATLSHLCEPYGRTIIIVPNKSLVEQTEEDYRNCGLDVGVYYGDRKELNRTHTICTWQSLNILDKKSKAYQQEILTLAEFLDGVNAVIVDECHGAVSAVLQKLLTENLNNASIRWGLTGTVPKDEYQRHSLFNSIGPCITGITAHELQEEGVLSKCHVNAMQLIDLPEFKTYADEQNYLVINDQRVEYISNFVKELSNSGNTLVLVNRIETGNKMKNIIGDCVFISGSVKTKDRKAEYDEVKVVDDKIIIATYGVAAVGINIVRIHNLVLVEPGKSFTRVIQSIGRGLRKGFDKDHVEIYDISSTCKFSKRHLTERKKFYREAQYPFTQQKINWTK